jgi:hypothetical protein
MVGKVNYLNKFYYTELVKGQIYAIMDLHLYMLSIFGFLFCFLGFFVFLFW